MHTGKRRHTALPHADRGNDSMLKGARRHGAAVALPAGLRVARPLVLPTVLDLVCTVTYDSIIQHTSPKSSNDGFLRDFRSFSRGAQRSISVSSHARLSLPRCRGTVRGGGTLPLGAPRGIYSGGGWAPPTAQPLAALPRCKRSRRPPILGKAVGQDTRTARTLSTGKSHTPCGRHASVGVSANHCVRPLCGSQGVCAAVTAEQSESTRTAPTRVERHALRHAVRTHARGDQAAAVRPGGLNRHQDDREPSSVCP
jgi:hypothetical protein